MALRLSRRSTIYFILLAGLLAMIWASYQSFNHTTAPAGKPLGDLLTALDAGQVASGVFTSDGERVDWVDKHGGRYRTLLPAGYSTTLVDKFHESQVAIDVTQSPASSVWLAVCCQISFCFSSSAGSSCTWFDGWADELLAFDHGRAMVT